MPFPIHDPYWVNALNFLQSHMKEEERLFAPGEFRGKLPSVRGFFPYGIILPEEDSNFQWAVIHKGLLNKIDPSVLHHITQTLIPVFANEVFVIFSNNKEVSRIDLSSLHLQSLWEKMGTKKPFKKGLKSILKSLLFREKEETEREEETKRGSDMSEERGDLAKRDSVYLGDFSALTRTVWGHKMFVDTRDLSLTPHILLDGFWEIGITRVFMDMIKERMNVVEIGANIGYYTLIGASQIGPDGRLFAFEADPRVFEILCRNIEINGLLERVTLTNQAVMDKSGSLKFHCSKHHHAGGSIVPFSEKFLRERREGSETIELEAVSLDEYFANQPIKIDALKIDAEGAEPFIFKGMKRLLSANRDIKIIFEFSPVLYEAQGLDPREFVNDILDQGFTLKLINSESQLEEVSGERLLEIRESEVFLERKPSSFQAVTQTVSDRIDYGSLSVDEIKKRMDERFKKGEAYDAVACLQDRIVAEEVTRDILQLIPSTSDKRILEIGCGNGGMAPFIPECKEYIGTDLSDEAILMARREFLSKPHFEFVAMDAMALTFDDGSFDIVIAREVVEHLGEPRKAIRGAFRVLKPGGSFIMTSPNRDSFHLRVNRMLGHKDFKCCFDHIKEFTFSEALEILTDEGFQIKESKGVFLLPYWGIPGIDEHVRHLTDNDPQMVEMLRNLGERVGPEYSFLCVTLAVKPSR